VTITDAPQADIKEKTADLSITNQDENAKILFQKISEVSEKTDRKTYVPQLEAMYLVIINKYPKAALAQEAYKGLLMIYINDYDPPAYDKIETTYAKFIEMHPGSPVRPVIEEDISSMYYRNAKWDSLMRFCSPAIKKFIATGKLQDARDMLLYSEAKFNLGDLKEAAKGFKIVIVNFPDTKESLLARQRLDAIADMKSKLN
jgi:tetratricopeptide (TPR) repeat protein